MALTITLTDRDAEGLAELIELAHRGREDFTHQASFGDYSAADQHAAAQRWEAAQRAAAALASQQTGQPHPVVTAAEDWADMAQHMDTDNLWEHFTCIEAEATARIAHAAGRKATAEMILDRHAEADTDPDDMHHRLRT